MNERVKQLLMNLLLIAIYIVCAVYYLNNAFGSWPTVYIFDMVIGLMWVAGVILWTVRTIRMWNRHH